MSVQQQLTALADQVRRLGNVTTPLTIEQMEATLLGVTAGGGAALFSSSASGNLPTIYRGAAVSELTPNFSSGASGALQEE